MRVQLGRAAGAPVTTGLLLLNGLIWLGQISPLGYIFTNSMFYAPLFTEYQPWRMITSGFVHDWSGPMHILLNSYAIWIFGRQLEPMLGKLRFLALYLVSIFAGSVAVLWLSDPQMPVVGASGGLFGLMGAYFIIVRSLGSNGSQIFVLIAINLAMGFFIPGISWEGHLGGLIGGLAMAGVYAETRRPEQRIARLLGVAGVVALLLLATWWKVTSSGWS
jgi:membrane associated rhomboid family serine protease